MIELTYVLPLRWDAEAEGDVEEMTGYLRELSRHVPVIVVDGSPGPIFADHAHRWGGMVRHVPPDPLPPVANGKVTGVITGVRLAATERVVIADDDVRYGAGALAAMHDLLGQADVVRPQNYFDPLPWHACWDTARSLLNRSLGADYPGTLGVRRSMFLRMGGYDGDTMFENLELIRTVLAHGGRERRAGGLFVRRLPPSTDRFWAQRVRQAYDDLAQPARLVFFLALLPALAVTPSRHRLRAVAAGAGVAVVLAEVGRCRDGGGADFPRTASLLAPVWVAERAVCVWWALALRLLLGGIRYRGGVVPTAAHSMRVLSRRAARGSPRFTSPAPEPPEQRPERAARSDAGAGSRDGAGTGPPAQPGGGSAPPGARKPATLCDPSQNGLVADRPHRHSATVARPGSMREPS